MEENKIKLSKKDVWKAFLKWTFFSHSNYNYERLQASGILQSMSHIPEKSDNGITPSLIPFLTPSSCISR